MKKKRSTKNKTATNKAVTGGDAPDGSADATTAENGTKGLEDPPFHAVHEFRVCDRVSLHGLSSSHYNGCHGIIKTAENKKHDGRFGVLIDGEHKPKAIKPKNLKPLYNKVMKTTEQKLQERKAMESMIEPRGDTLMNADQLGFMRMMMNMFMTEERQIQLYGRKIEPLPDFSMEMKKRGLPMGVDSEWAEKYLRLAYENSSGLPHMYEIVFKSPVYEPEAESILKRLGTNDRSKLKWYFGNRSPGDIYPNRKAYPYCDLVRHSFSNQAYRKEKLRRGKTHVAIGMVDLGILFAAELEGPLGEPLHFVGVDMNAYTVAKTMVVWEMLRRSTNTPDEKETYLWSIVQVWFSATWSQGTEEAAKTAISSLLAASSPSVMDSQVRGILEYWSTAPRLSLQQSRSAVAAATTNNRSNIAQMSMQQDRIAIAEYELTKDFGIYDRNPVCGNLIMFDCPDGTPPIDHNESVFSALPWTEVMETLKNSEFHTRTIIDAAEEVAFRGVRKLAAWARNRDVTVECICAKVEDIVKDIASQMPWTMSWSNIVDYMDYQDFHRLARACSLHGNTVHFGYTMNWTIEVHGTNIMDYRGAESAAFRANLLEIAHKSAETYYCELGWDRRLRLPPPSNPINTTSHFALEIKHYKRWTDNFFGIAQSEGSCQVGNIEKAVGMSPLSFTGDSTIFYTFTYDPEIHFYAA